MIDGHRFKRAKAAKHVGTGFVLALALLGCATTANYEKSLSSWAGAPADNLVRAWGAPTSSVRLQSGHQIYVYDHHQTNFITTPAQVQQNPGMSAGGMYYPGPATVTGGQVIPVDWWCRTEFEIDEAGRIVSWRWQGNNCVAHAPKE